MIKVNAIISNEKYQKHLQKIKDHEVDRFFCKHDMAHFLDVSRIAWILNLEEALNIDKEIIYATGLLHDIGRWKQYEKGVDHAMASSELAERILIKTGFNEAERWEIKKAIENHRLLDTSHDLSRIIYKADKVSRPCFTCPSIGECKRFQNKEKPTLIY